MTDTAISPLRQRMIEDMTIRKLRPYAPASANAEDLDRQLMTAVNVSPFPHPADIRGWLPGRQPKRTAREQSAAVPPASGSINVRPKSPFPAHLIHHTASPHPTSNSRSLAGRDDQTP
jgi:hypothetical protein